MRNDCLVRFPTTASIGEVERRLAAEGPALAHPATNLTLDFSRSSYIEVPSLIHIIALLADRHRKQETTRLILPQSKKVRDFLRVWEFARAVYSVTGERLYDLVTAEDHKHFGENIDLLDQTYIGRVHRIDGELERELSNRFFAITPFHNSARRFTPSLALNEASRWKRQIIASVLDNVLLGPEGLFPSRIVFEAMMNAVRHPAATTILTTSHFQNAGTRSSRRGYFTIVFWDNGESLVDTLRRAMLSGEAVRISEAIDLRTSYFYRTVIGYDGQESKGETVHSDYLPDVRTPDDLLLVSATFPGITSDPAGHTHLPPPDVSDAAHRLPGMGLYLLLNAATSVYGGSVNIRTKDMFLRLKPCERGESDYDAKLRFVRNAPPFLGNMLTVRLPLHPGPPA